MECCDSGCTAGRASVLQLAAIIRNRRIPDVPYLRKLPGEVHRRSKASSFIDGLLHRLRERECWSVAGAATITARSNLPKRQCRRQRRVQRIERNVQGKLGNFTAAGRSKLYPMVEFFQRDAVRFEARRPLRSAIKASKQGLCVH